MTKVGKEHILSNVDLDVDYLFPNGDAAYGVGSLTIG